MKFIRVYNFTNFEKEILKAIKEEYKYIARDENGNIYVYTEKPDKISEIWYSLNGNSTSVLIPIDDLFSCIQWSDNEPCEFRKYLD